jgi:hypothetical protein
MSKKKVVKKKVIEGISDRLDLEPYHQLCAGLWQWRIDDFVRGLEQKEGSILAFVRGLHFSAQLIYAIRDIISEEGLKADWGHLLDRTGKYCSRECDIIIHKGKCNRWNGHKNPVMNFKFVKQDKAVAVISCKSYMRSGSVDKNYVRCLRPFVKRIWLIAECCELKHTKSIAQQAQGAGYQNFWYMYKWSRETSGREENESGWLDFVKKLRRLKA